MPEKKDPKTKFWPRVVIILYGLGLVILGGYPIQRQYGGVLAFLEVEFGRIARLTSELQSGRARLKLPSVSFRSEQELGPVIESRNLSTKEKSVDHLTNRDRKALNKLLEDI